MLMIQPALTPFLLAVRVSPRTLPSSKNEAHSNSNRMFRFTWLPTAVAVVSVWILHPELTLSVTVVSFVAFLAQLSVFVSLVQLSEDGVDASNPPRVSKVIRNVSAQTCGFLLFTLIFMASFGLYQSSEKPDFLETAQLGLFKLAQVIGACHLVSLILDMMGLYSRIRHSLTHHGKSSRPDTPLRMHLPISPTLLPLNRFFERPFLLPL